MLGNARCSLVLGMHMFVPDVHVFWSSFFKDMLTPLLGSEIGSDEAVLAVSDDESPQAANSIAEQSNIL